MLVAEDIGRAYDSYYTSAPRDRSGAGASKRFGATFYRLDRWASRLLRLEAERRRHAAAYLDGTPPGTLLDVGCGSGAYAASMQARGWNVRGTEFDPMAARNRPDEARHRRSTSASSPPSAIPTARSTRSPSATCSSTCRSPSAFSPNAGGSCGREGVSWSSRRTSTASAIATSPSAGAASSSRAISSSTDAPRCAPCSAASASTRSRSSLRRRAATTSCARAGPRARAHGAAPSTTSPSGGSSSPGPPARAGAATSARNWSRWRPRPAG